MQRMIAMKINFDTTIINALPTFKLGLNHYTNITVSESPQMLKGRLRLFQEFLFFDLEDKPLDDFPGVKEWREIWTTIGADSILQPHSTERIMQRIGEQNYIETKNSAIDLNMFFSLQYQIPIGIYDADKIQGDITIKLGDAEAGYDGLNRRFNTLENIPILTDAQGSFGSPYVDSVRTAVSNETTHAIQVFFLRPSMQIGDAAKLTEASGRMFTEINGGDSLSKTLYNK